MASPKIRTFREVVPFIYSWSTPDLPKYAGWEKIGYTEQGSAEARVAQQASQLHIEKRIEWSLRAFFMTEAGRPLPPACAPTTRERQRRHRAAVPIHPPCQHASSALEGRQFAGSAASSAGHLWRVPSSASAAAGAQGRRGQPAGPPGPPKA